MKQELLIRKTNDVYGIITRIRNIIKDLSVTTNNNMRNDDDIEMIISIYTNELMPEIKNLQRLKYDIIETEITLMNKNEGNITTLRERETAISNMVYTFDAPPKILRFVTMM